MNIDIFDIPVPWGHISVKTWGKKTSQPAIALHGIQDNAGTFDRLIPLLKVDFYWVCVDFPSHGKSSHFPSGLPLEFIHFVYAVKIVVDYLKFDKIYLMGHSLGAQVGSFFSAIFPEHVIKLVLIDGMVPPSVDNFIGRIRNYYDQTKALEESLANKNPPSHSYVEALNRMKTNRPNQLTDEAAKALIRRSLTPSGSGLRFATDQRLKLYLKPAYTADQIISIVMGIKCQVFLIVAENTYSFFKGKHDNQELYNEKNINIVKQMPNVRFAIVKGNHDLHLNTPEAIAPQINKFFSQTNSSL